MSDPGSRTYIDTIVFFIQATGDIIDKTKQPAAKRGVKEGIICLFNLSPHFVKLFLQDLPCYGSITCKLKRGNVGIALRAFTGDTIWFVWTGLQSAIFEIFVFS